MSLKCRSRYPELQFHITTKPINLCYGLRALFRAQNIKNDRIGPQRLEA